MATEVKKPTDFTEDASALWTDEALAYDQAGAGDETTLAYAAPEGDVAPSITWHTWAIKGQTYTATVLKVKWDCVLLTGDDHWGIEYTKNGGGAWADLLADGLNRSATIVTTEIALDTNQDLTQVQIRLNIVQEKGSDGHTVRIYDVWTEGEYTAGATAVDGSDPATATEITGPTIQAIRAIDAADLSTAPEITGGGVEVAVTAIDVNAVDLSTAPEITAPTLQRIQIVDASDLSVLPEITKPGIDRVRQIIGGEVSSPTEIIDPALNRVRPIDGADVSTATEITSPALNKIQPITGNEVSSSTEITDGPVTVAGGPIDINAADISSGTEIAGAAVQAVRAIFGGDVSTPTEITAPVIQIIKQVVSQDVASPTQVTAATIQAVRQLSGQDLSSDIEITDPALTKIQPVNAGDISSLPEITGGSVALSAGIKDIKALDILVGAEITSGIIGLGAKRETLELASFINQTLLKNSEISVDLQADSIINQSFPINSIIELEEE